MYHRHFLLVKTGNRNTVAAMEYAERIEHLLRRWSLKDVLLVTTDTQLSWYMCQRKPDLKCVHPYSTTGVEFTPVWLVVVPSHDDGFWSETAGPYLEAGGHLVHLDAMMDLLN